MSAEGTRVGLHVATFSGEAMLRSSWRDGLESAGYEVTDFRVSDRPAYEEIGNIRWGIRRVRGVFAAQYPFDAEQMSDGVSIDGGVVNIVDCAIEESPNTRIVFQHNPAFFADRLPPSRVSGRPAYEVFERAEELGILRVVGLNIGSVEGELHG